MNEKFIEKKLKDMRSQIKINNDLKQKLRNSFTTEAKSTWKISATATIAIAVCLVMIIYIVLPNKLISKVDAASLKILNQVSFVDFGGDNVDATEYNGTIYSAIFGKGIYAYDSTGYRKIYGKDVNDVSASNDGKMLAFSDESLKIFDIAKSRITTLLESTDYIYYQQPSWSFDNEYILFVKKVMRPRETHGFEVVSTEICKINLKTMEVNKLAEGSSPSFADREQIIVFEKENKIIKKYIKDGTEKVIDDGRFPSVSPDGEYVAYVKTERKETKISSNLFKAENIADVWIADVNIKTSKRLTNNYLRPESENGNINNGSNIPMTIEKEGLYSYYNPKWSSNSESLYVLKNNNMRQNMRLMRISFTDKNLTPQDTVRRFMQALVTRDDDYAKSLIKDPTSIMTVSNPHPVGYKILESGKKNGENYVDAEIYLAYTAEPDFYFGKQRYYLSPVENGYIIDRIIDGTGGAVYLSKDGKSVILQTENEKVLFNISDIPEAYLPKGKYRLASLAFDEQKGILIFTIQILQDVGQKSSVKILSYSIKDSKFNMIDQIEKLQDLENVGVENLILDPSGNYAAVDLFSDDNPKLGTTVYIYNLSNNERIKAETLLKNTIGGGIHTKFWNDDTLILELTNNGQTMIYSYNPASGKLSSFHK